MSSGSSVEDQSRCNRRPRRDSSGTTTSIWLKRTPGATPGTFWPAARHPPERRSQPAPWPWPTFPSSTRKTAASFTLSPTTCPSWWTRSTPNSSARRRPSVWCCTRCLLSPATGKRGSWSRWTGFRPTSASPAVTPPPCPCMSHLIAQGDNASHMESWIAVEIDRVSRRSPGVAAGGPGPGPGRRPRRRRRLAQDAEQGHRRSRRAWTRWPTRRRSPSCGRRRICCAGSTTATSPSWDTASTTSSTSPARTYWSCGRTAGWACFVKRRAPRICST